MRHEVISGLPGTFMCFGGGVALQSDYAGRVGNLLSKQTCYC